MKTKLLSLSWLALAAPALSADFILSSDGATVSRLTAGSSLPASSFNSSVFLTSFPGWTINSGFSGGVAISQYDAALDPSGSMGGRFDASFSSSSPVASGHSINWVQFINTNRPLGGTSTTYVDPRPNDDTLPFYWTLAENAGKSSAATSSFSDFSKRDPSAIAPDPSINWSAALYPVDWDGGTSINVGVGASWGWTLKPATQGLTAGTFTNPSPSTAIVSGVGTSSFSWGDGTPSNLSFVGGAYVTTPNSEFKLGTLSFSNGTIFSGEASAVDLNISVGFTNVPELNLVHSTTLSINNTPNTADPVASADFVAFTSGGFTHTFNIFEGASASVDLMGKLTPVLTFVPSPLVGDKLDESIPIVASFTGYSLEITSLVSPTSGGFTTTSNVPDHGGIELEASALMLILTILFWTRRKKEVLT